MISIETHINMLHINHILNVFHGILVLGGVVLTHTIFTTEMHHLRIRFPLKNHDPNFDPPSNN